MEMKEFKKELKKTGVPFSLVVERFTPDFDNSGAETLKELVKSRYNFHDVIVNLCMWDDSPEDWDFWDDVSDRVEILKQFKVLANVLGYEVQG